MALSGRTSSCAHIIIINFLLLFICNMVFGTATDIFCLKSIKDSLADPYGHLKSSWDFRNNTEGFICRFTGVQCWKPDENRVISLKLSNTGLKGQFLRAIQNCSSLQGLDLSINQISGTIPEDIDHLLPYLVSLNLSSNDFSGPIPVGLANCSYLNFLSLDRNRLGGKIPEQFSRSLRLGTFTVTNNLLKGPVPYLENITADSYANNSGLCGGPLPACGTKRERNAAIIIAGAAFGGAILGSGVAFFLYRSLTTKKSQRDT
ncbi:inactive LRR receptor-like serine/threonine-protein kinase BIR2 [Neltuma alba]|uniref:inactive LRR receptor-like serine/threonine-protein kinase BIR2 n=1 Tax=Neltuma alba TaxID=207710 RepID=UPI0010A3AA07|nr:inactive LRR receptor-like serine/threonine-protein kinase BIR2 [Prosopis alba]